MIDVPLSVRVISKEEIESAPQLDIEVIEGTVIERGKIFSMNAGGMIGSKRASNDGCLFMGTQQTNPDVYIYIYIYLYIYIYILFRLENIPTILLLIPRNWGWANAILSSNIIRVPCT